jgi:RHS repeat-associated protein
MYFDAVRVLEGNLISSYTYDANGNYVTSVKDQLGNITSMVNDNRGNATQVTDAKNNVMNYSYDKLDRLKHVENPKELISAYFYDNESNLTQIDNHKRTGPTTSEYINTAIYIEYNEQLLPKAIYDGNWRSTLLEYNKKKFLKDIKYPNGMQVHNQYDASDRVQYITYTGDTTQWSFTYDANSNLTSTVKNGTETTSFDYDNLNRMSKITYPAVFNVRDNIQYLFNPNSQTISSQYSILPAISQKTIYEYDQADNNMVITGPNNTRAEFMYDEESRLKKSDIRISDVQKYNTYNDYDVAGRIIGMRTENAVGLPLLDWSYFYDENSNRIKDINNLTKKRIEYTYDSIKQLIEESYFDDLTTQTPSKKITYQYDLLGNCIQKTVSSGTITTTTYSYNSANEIVNVNGVQQYTHDYNGNMTGAYGNVVALSDETGNRVINYEYDAWGNLTNTPESVTIGNGEYLRNANPFRYSSYQFDPESGLYYLKARYYSAAIGRFLTRDTLYELQNGSLLINQYVYCYNNPILQIDLDGHFVNVIIGAALAAVVAYLLYRLEIWAGLREYNLGVMIAIVGLDASMGAFNNMLFGIRLGKFFKVIGILEKMKTHQKDIKLFKAIFTVRKMVVIGLLKKFTRKEGESWLSFVKRFIKTLGFNA